MFLLTCLLIHIVLLCTVYAFGAGWCNFPQLHRQDVGGPENTELQWLEPLWNHENTQPLILEIYHSSLQYDNVIAASRLMVMV